ncbi:hypothetical protein G7092_09880 [Mucilaginibacter sp. HC2]|uniref:hypothetical protein n=1 Tax=Mucilaginibacter inviolabilis TaxID=2714892 RepID=UPI00140DF35C|nr:hypothetical protein [Mucilaginibacter inviolabilis]NHA04107.1 hypothetical protein [Mucilaginibacter inviolabilis]
MANDKKISDLPIVSTISANDNSVLVKNGTDYQFAFDTLLQFIGSELSVGANITFGSTLPPNNTGKNGDIFINTTTGSFAQKLTNTWTVVYTLPQGNNTVDGTVLYGNSNPGTLIGNNNDTFINTASGIFFKKSTGVWNQVFSMQTGPAGPRGNSVLNGSVDPTAAIGQSGDFYYNTATQYIFGPKSASAWPTGTRLKGANGNTILHGTTTPSNLNDGVDGDFFINISTYNIFGPKVGGIWPAPFSLIYDLGYTPENSANKNQPNGYAGLDGTGKVAASQLPSYVDDVLEFASYATLPLTGETGKIYVTLETNLEYRWSGSAYIQLVASPGTTDNVPEGSTNKYFTAARVLNTFLTGISFLTNTAVLATDTILQALGKLQAQFNSLLKIPAGGTTGQVLAKTSSIDGDTHWIDMSEGSTSETIDPYPTLPTNAGKDVEVFGTSISAGYAVNLPDFPFGALFGQMTGMQTYNNRAQSATNSFSALRQYYANMPVSGNKNIISLIEMGFNDFQNTDNAKNCSKIFGCLSSALVSSFTEVIYAGNFNFMQKTGAWADYDTSIHGGKAAYIPQNQGPPSKGISSNVAGSTYTIGGKGAPLVIGTYADDGSGTNPLGGFTVSVNGKVIYTYSPTGKTNGLTDNSNYDNSITPYPILIKSQYPDFTITITTLDNLPTIIDYIAFLGDCNIYPPAFVALIPERSDAAYAATSGLASKAKTAEANMAIKNAVAQFAGYPVTIYDPNSDGYDPNNIDDSADGVHPTALGHQLFLKSLLNKTLPVVGYPMPGLPDGSTEKVVSVVATGPVLNYDVVNIFVAPTNLTNADWTTGVAAVTGAIGQESADTNYRYKCIGVNQWIRQLIISPTILDYYIGTIDDSGGDKTSTALQTAFPSALVGQHVRGVNKMYEKINSTDWIKTAIAVA